MKFISCEKTVFIRVRVKLSTGCSTRLYRLQVNNFGWITGFHNTQRRGDESYSKSFEFKVTRLIIWFNYTTIVRATSEPQDSTIHQSQNNLKINRKKITLFIKRNWLRLPYTNFHSTYRYLYIKKNNYTK